MLMRKVLVFAAVVLCVGSGFSAWSSALAADKAGEPVAQRSDATGNGSASEQSGLPEGRPFADVPIDDAGYAKGDRIDFFIGRQDEDPPLERTSPVPPAAGVMTLEQACHLAVQNHPSIESATADYDEARADYQIARSVYYPRVDWATKVGPSTELDTGATEYGDSALLMTQKLYKFGGIRASVASSRLSFEGAELQYTRACEDIAALAINAYLAVLQSEELVRIHEGALGFYRKLQSSFQERFVAGISSRADAKKVEVSLRDAQAQLVKQNEQLNTSRSLLENIIGSPVQAVEPNVDLLRVTITGNLEDAFLRVLDSNRKLQALERQMAAQRKSIESSRADYYPVIGYRVQVKNEFQKMESPDECTQTAEAQLTLDWNLFSGFSTDNEIRKKQAILRRLVASKRSIELDIRNTLTDALNAYKASAEEQKLAQEAFDSSISLMSMYLSEFDLGIRTLLDLTAAREGQTSAAVREISARFARIRAAVSLLLEEGRLGTTLKLSFAQ